MNKNLQLFFIALISFPLIVLLPIMFLAQQGHVWAMDSLNSSTSHHFILLMCIFYSAILLLGFLQMSRIALQKNKTGFIQACIYSMPFLAAVSFLYAAVFLNPNAHSNPLFLWVILFVIIHPAIMIFMYFFKNIEKKYGKKLAVLWTIIWLETMIVWYLLK